jgi:hypothetical protein
MSQLDFTLKIRYMASKLDAMAHAWGESRDGRLHVLRS